MKPRHATLLPTFLTGLSLCLLCTHMEAGNNDPPDSSLTISGNHVVVNDDDANNNQVWDKSENPTEDTGLQGGGTGFTPLEEPKLVEFQINAIYVPGAECTLTVQKSGPFDTAIKLWKDAGKTQPFTLAETYSITDTDSGTIQFYVEGLEPTEDFKSLGITATYEAKNQYGSNKATSEIRFGVTRADVDVDSNNNGSIEDDSKEEIRDEDQLEFSSNEDHLGKILLENNNDVDNDGLLDCFDGLGLTSPGSSPGVAGLNLTPLKVKLHKPYTTAKAQVTFTYTASVPRVGAGISSTGTGETVTYTTAQRGLRLWKVDGHARTNGIDVTTTGGHFIPSGISIPWTSIATPNQDGTFPDEATLYLEYVDLPTDKTYTKENILLTISEKDTPNDKKGYIKNHGTSTSNYLAKKTSPDAVCASLVPMDLIAHKRGTIDKPGPEQPKGNGEYGYETVMMENADSEDNILGKRDCDTDNAQANRDKDDDFVKIVLHYKGPQIEGASLKLLHEGIAVDAKVEGKNMENREDAIEVLTTGSRMNFYDKDGRKLDPAKDLKIDNLKNPGDSYLAQILNPGNNGKLVLFIEGKDKFGLVGYNDKDLAKLGASKLNFRLEEKNNYLDKFVIVYRGGFLAFRQPKGMPGVIGNLEFWDGKGRVRHKFGGYKNEFLEDVTDYGQKISSSWPAKSGKPVRDGKPRPYNVSGAAGHIPPGWYWEKLAEVANSEIQTQSGTKVLQGGYARWKQDETNAYAEKYVYDFANPNDKKVGPPDKVYYKFQLDPINNWKMNSSGNKEYLGRTRCQIHPDGSHDGTLGCIGMQSWSDCKKVKYVLSSYNALKVKVELN